MNVCSSEILLISNCILIHIAVIVFAELIVVVLVMIGTDVVVVGSDVAVAIAVLLAYKIENVRYSNVL
jgi:hypothetical protein